MISPNNVEESILSAYLFFGTMDFHDQKNIFKLNTSYFNSPFKKRVAERINELIDKGSHSFQLLSTKIEDSIKGSNYELEFLNIMAQTPMDLKIAREYHDDFLREKYKEKIILGVA